MNSSQTIEARHISRDLAVTDLDSSEWDQVEPQQIDHYWSGAPAPAGRHAEARILWSKSALHLRFVCAQFEPLIISDRPQTARKTMGLWDRDVCEVFIAPNPQSIERYLELEAAPTGEWLDTAIQWTPNKRECDWQFNSHMTTAARVEKERVTISMRIPWNQWIHEPHRGERWRVNLFRCVGTGETRGYLSWQATRTPQPNFHVPQVFGWLVFK